MLLWLITQKNKQNNSKIKLNDSYLGLAELSFAI